VSGMSTFGGETLITKPGSREESIRAVTAVLRRIPDVADQRAIIEALFAEGKRRPPRGFRGGSPRDESGLKPCGTEAAYQRHKARGEECEPCRLAANKARAESQRRVRARRKAEAAAKAAA
jgi:hypothetical protein